MDKQALAIILLVIAILASLFYAIKINTPNKLLLDKRDVSKITICQPDPICNKRYILDDAQTRNFIQLWAKAKNIGYNKISCNYYLTVFLLNGSKHTFGIAANKMSENWGGGYIYSIENPDYFDSLYSQLSH